MSSSIRILAAALAVLGVTALGLVLILRDNSAPAKIAPQSAVPTVHDPTAVPTPTRDPLLANPGWQLALREADLALPRYDQVVNGIAIGPTATSGSNGLCSPGEARSADPAEAALLDPEMVLPLQALPPGSVVDRQQAVVCGDHVTSIEATVVFQGDGAPPGSGVDWFGTAHGGSLDVYKSRVSSPGFRSDIASERWEAFQVGGLPAALGRAIHRDEFGPSAIVVWDAKNHVQVVVRGSEIELQDLIAAAAEAVR